MKQISGERLQDHWSSGYLLQLKKTLLYGRVFVMCRLILYTQLFPYFSDTKKIFQQDGENFFF